MKTAVVLPTYNEADNLPQLVQSIFALGLLDLFVVVVDDGSPDGTGQLADELSHRYPVFVLHRERKLGLGSAYRTGFDFCLAKGAEYIFEMDADFSHDPKDLPRLLAAAKGGGDLVIGSRKIVGGKILGWSWKRRLYSDGAMFFARFLLGLKTHDITAGFRCFRAQALQKIAYHSIESNGYAFQVEMIYALEKAGLKVIEIPVIFPDRRLGISKLNKKDILEFFRLVFKLKFKK
jgi:dolichol-phosphate mannosyltransferase